MLVKSPPTSNNLGGTEHLKRLHHQQRQLHTKQSSSSTLEMMDVTVCGRMRASHLCIIFLVILNTFFHINYYHKNLPDSSGTQTRVSTAPIYTRTTILKSNEILVQYGDSVYTQGNWDGAPVVIEQYKLLFFTSAKVGCTIWKQLFRRMMNISNYMEEEYETLIPWNPEVNGLKYLYHYNRTTATMMMTDPTWTRALFVRDPKERFLSAYLDKVVQNQDFFDEKCCPYRRTCGEQARASIENFVKLMRTCANAHWSPQSKRLVEDKYWPYINFVGNMDHLYDDAKSLLQHIGAWEVYGKSGWGPNRTLALFQSQAGSIGRIHATAAVSKMKKYITPKIEKELDQFYEADYDNNVLNLKRRSLYSER